MKESAILSLALLKANWDLRERDYVEFFLPMIAECLKEAPVDVISLPSLQQAFQDGFGLSLPQHAISLLLTRARKRGFVRRENRLLYRVPESLEGLTFRDSSKEVLRQHEALVAAFRAFCSGQFRVDLSEEQAEKAFEDYFRSLHFVVSPSEHGSLLPERPVARRERYWVGAFITHLRSVNAAEFSYVETVYQSVLIANAMFLPDPNSAMSQFRGTAVYLDTPFLICALGYEGPVRKSPCSELLDLLRLNTASMRCFDHTLQETKGILTRCSNALHSGDLRDIHAPPCLTYFLQAGKTSSDIELLIAQLEGDLKRLGVSVVGQPAYVAQYTIDEQGLEDHLRHNILYRTDLARSRDVESVSAVMRLRRGMRASTIEEAKALLVTNNAALVRVVGDFFPEEPVFPAITDFTLANLLWIKTPLAAPALPRKRVVADAYAAIQPDERLWRAIITEANKLLESGRINTGEYYLFRSSLHLKQMATEATLGDEALLTQGTVIDLLEKEKATIREDADRARDEAQNRASKLQAEKEEHTMRLATSARRLAKTVVTTARILTMLPLCFGVIAVGVSAPPFLGRVGAALGVLVQILGVFEIAHGRFARRFLDKLKTKVFERRLEWLLGHYGLPGARMSPGFVGSVTNPQDADTDCGVGHG